MLLLLFKRHWFMRILYFVKNAVNITISKIDKHLSPISITYCYVSGVYTITLKPLSAHIAQRQNQQTYQVIKSLALLMFKNTCRSSFAKCTVCYL